MNPNTLRKVRGLTETDKAAILACANAWDDDILRQDVYDENYRKELAKNNTLRQRLGGAEKVRYAAQLVVDYEMPKVRPTAGNWDMLLDALAGEQA